MDILLVADDNWVLRLNLLHLLGLVDDHAGLVNLVNLH